MTKDEFWQMMADNMQDYDCEACCPVKVYAVEHCTEPLCDQFGDCADALKALCKELEREGK